MIKALCLSVVFTTAAAFFYKRKSIHARSIHTRPYSKVWPWMTPTLAFAVIWLFNSLRPRQNRRHFADDVFKCNFMNENVWIPIKISLKFVPEGPINNISALVQIMAWRRIGDDPVQRRIYASLGLNELIHMGWNLIISLGVHPSSNY